MKEIIILGTGAGLTFLCFIVLIIIGVDRKSRAILVLSIIFIVISGTTGVIAVYKAATKSYHKVTDIFKPRTGAEIYAALFEGQTTNCVQILDVQDQIVPRIDYAIWMHLKTCPTELTRILSQQDYDFEVISTAGMNSCGPSSHVNWFKPELLGDTILEFAKIDEYGNGQVIYSNQDSTEIYVKDIFD